jgi:NAD(P)-dependent dehydrogenase (short-subunit alcohol dehydrogenase family)
MGRFDGKVALLTGAASAVEGELMGFAGAVAWRFMREGGKGVVLTDVKDDAGEKSAASLRKAGFDAVYTHLDVTDEAGWKAAVSMAEKRHGRLDVLVNAAGAIDRRSISDTPVDDWRRVMDITTTGVFLGTKCCADLMKRSGGGSIVNISSMASRMAMPYAAAYSTSRAGIVQFGKVAAIQYAKDGIRVNAVLPGWVHTPFTTWAYNDEAQRNVRSERVPLGRWGTPEEIAAAILFLASDDASYITGTELLVDGGVIAATGAPLPPRPDAK